MVYQDVDHTICSVGKNGVLGARWLGINWCRDDHGHFMKIRWLHDPGCFMTHQPCVSMLSQLLTKETTMSNHMLLNLSHVFRGSNPCKGWLNPIKQRDPKVYGHSFRPHSPSKDSAIWNYETKTLPTFFGGCFSTKMKPWRAVKEVRAKMLIDPRCWFKESPKSNDHQFHYIIWYHII